MPEMEYNSNELRTGGAHADAAAESAGSAASTLRGAQAGASPFGDVNGAGALHGAVSHAQQVHSVSAQTSAHNMGVAATRARGTAALADDNTDETTRLAPRSDRASAVSKGM